MTTHPVSNCCGAETFTESLGESTGQGNTFTVCKKCEKVCDRTLIDNEYGGDFVNDKGAVAKSKVMQDKVFSEASPKGLSRTVEDQAKKELVDHLNLEWRYSDGTGKPVTYLDIADLIKDSMDTLNFHKKQWLADLIRAVGEELKDYLSDVIIHECGLEPDGHKMNTNSTDEVVETVGLIFDQKLQAIINQLSK